MSSIVVNIPDCARPDYTSSSDRDAITGQITISTHDCPRQPPGPPGLFTTGNLVAAVFITIALVAGVVTVRLRAHAQKPKKLEQKRLARQQEIDGQVALAKAHRQCMTCGDKYEPELT